MSIKKDKKNLAIKLDSIANLTVSSALIPVVTNKGISIGSYMIKPIDGSFSITDRGFELYRTYNKTAAMIIAGMLNKKMRSIEIQKVLDADRVAFTMRNDLDTFKYHYNKAIENNDDCKKSIMSARYECANNRYLEAKQSLKESYSKLF